MIYSPQATTTEPSYGTNGLGMGMPTADPRSSSTRSVPVLLDPALVRSARQIYRQFYEAHPEVVKRPVGVALNRYNYRGKLIFGQKPILLPDECFVPLDQVQSELF